MALEDASVLKCKEWNRGESGGDTPQMYSIIDGNVTPTAPVYEDMRTETPLNVMPEESLGGLSAAMGGMEVSHVTQWLSDDARGPVSNVMPPAEDVSETSPKMVNERSSQEGLPRRNEVLRETSREDALAATRLFFNTVAKRRNIPEVPVTSTAGVSQTDTPPALSAPVETEPAEPETSSSRTFLPSGSPPRHTATATCRPQTWVQCVSEGQIEEHSREDEDSVESEPLEPLVLKGLPDELGPEWRVLHPFEIPEVRFPTEDTPPNHRRLAESDALVELIQTAEYLEDAPSWGQRRFFPPWYGDPYYRGRGRGHGRGRGRSWLNEDFTERDSGGGWGRISFHGNGRSQETFWRISEHNIQDRRNDIQQEFWMPPDPLPSRFLDWGSLGSPHMRASPHGAPDIEVEKNGNIENQLSVQSVVVPRQETARTGSLEEVNISPPNWSTSRRTECSCNGSRTHAITYRSQNTRRWYRIYWRE